jgi:hypothetical protein
MVKTTQAHELLAQSFWKACLRMKKKNFFPHDHDASDSKDD